MSRSKEFGRSFVLIFGLFMFVTFLLHYEFNKEITQEFDDEGNYEGQWEGHTNIPYKNGLYIPLFQTKHIL